MVKRCGLFWEDKTSFSLLLFGRAVCEKITYNEIASAYIDNVIGGAVFQGGFVCFSDIGIVIAV